MQKKITFLTAAVFLSIPIAFSQPCSNLFFSEYIEGTSNNKALEIYNSTSNTINLGTYMIHRITNGGCPTSFTRGLTGQIAPGDVFVLAHSSSDSLILLVTDDTTTFINHNGNDSYILIDTLSGDTVDIIGQPCIDPGTEWTVGTGTTKEYTLLRMAAIQQGQLTWLGVGDTEWDVNAQNTFSFLGSHTMQPCLPAPLVADFSASDACLGDTTSFTDLSVANVDTVRTWNWNFGDSLGISTMQNPTYVYGSVGTYTVTLIITNDSADADTVSKTVTVNPQANATINTVSALCSNDLAITLTTVDSGGVWSGTGITDSLGGMFDPVMAGSGTHVISYNISGTCGDSDTINVVVNVAPNATITPVGTLCETESPALLLSVDTGGTWSGNGLTQAGATFFDPGTAGIGTHTITYSITSGSCSDSDTEDIIVASSPDATITSLNIALCTADSDTTLTAANGGGVWSGTGITDSTAGTFSPVVAGVGTHTITYTISAGSCTDAQTANVVVSQSDDATISAAGAFCETDAAVTLAAATAGGIWSGTGIADPALGLFDPAIAGAGTHTITYLIDNGNCQSSDTQDIVVTTGADATISPAGPFCGGDAVITLNAAMGGGTWSGIGITNPSSGTFDPSLAGVGTHTITYTISGTCGDTATMDIVVDAVPTTVFSYNISGTTVTFVNTTSGGATYSWSFGDGSPDDTTASPSHTYVNEGTYYVCLTATSANGCSNLFCDSVAVSTTAINENELLGLELKIYPIPSDDGLLTMDFGNFDVENKIEIIVFNLIGDVLFADAIIPASNQSKFTMNLNTLPSGTYFVNVNADGTIVSKRITINR
ncbi:lamin tail domain-containing protein [Bacteroidales bacterium AH-315-I05]|nr:lamin tail domain-containing protein [Bacteroidales bacterium AH-315-I05]